MDFDMVTIQDCVDMYDKKGKAAVISNGQLTGFVKEGGESKKIAQ